MKFRYALLALCLVSVVPAHAQQGSSRGGKPPQEAQQKQQPRREKQFPLGASWVAVSLNDKPLPRGAQRPSFTVDQTLRMRGFGGCNSFSATAYPLRGQTFAVGPFALTKRSCSKDVEATERAFFIALRTAQRWDIVGGQLVLQGQAGVVKADRSL